MSSGVKISLEEHEALRKRVDELEDQLTEEVSRISKELAQMRGRVHSVEQRLDEGDLDVDDDVVEDLRKDIEELRHVVNIDLDGKSYHELTRDDKVREIQATLLQEAESRQTHKSAMNYTDVKWLFNGKPSTGHVYDIMQVAGEETGFEYQERDEKNRIVVNARDVPDGVKQSLQVSRSE